MVINGFYIDSDTFFMIFFSGIAVFSFYTLINSFCEYLINKAWLVNDYEKMIYNYYYLDEQDDNDVHLFHSAVASYEERLKRNKKIKKFFSKFKIKIKR